MKNQIVTFKADQDFIDKLKSFSKKQDRPVSSVIRLAIKKYIDDGRIV
jgi:predicted transcriptional regulator